MPKLGLGQTIGKKALTTPGIISTGRSVHAPFSSPDESSLCPNLIPDVNELSGSGASSGTRTVVGNTIVFDSCGSSGAQTQFGSRDYILNHTYKVQFTVSDYVGDGVNNKINISIGNTQAPESHKAAANGTYIYYIKFTAGAAASYFYASNFTGTVSDISVTHVKSRAGQALEFDGIVDHIDFNTSVADSPIDKLTFSDFTIAVWVNVDNTSPSNDAFYNIVDAPGDDPGQYVAIDVSPLQAVINTGAGGWQNSSKTLTANQWHRLVWTFKASTGHYQIFQDGVRTLNYTDTTNAGNVQQFHGIGALNTETTPDRLFHGMMADFQIWDTVWNESNASDDFNQPESLVNLPYENLKLWYPMQDSTGNKQTYLVDGSSTGLGPELWVDGTNNLASDGLNFHSQSAGNDTDLRITRNGSEHIIESVDSSGDTSALAYLSGRTASGSEGSLNVDLMARQVAHKITFKAKAESLTTGLIRIVQDGVNAPIFSGGTQISPSGFSPTDKYIEYESYIGPDMAMVNTNAYINAYSLSAGDKIYIKDISVRSINDKVKGESSFLSDDLLQKGNPVDDNSDWTAGTGWTADASNEKLTGSSTTDNIRATTTTAFVNGDQISVTFTVANYSAGSVRMIVGGSNNGTTRNANGTYTEVVTVSGMAGSYIYFDGVTAFTGDITDITVKKVGFATGWTAADAQIIAPQTSFQNFNELAVFDNSSSDYAVISDQSYFSFGDGTTGNESAFSLSAWIFMQDATNFPIFSKATYNSGGTDALEWSLRTNSDDKLVFILYNNGTGINDTINVISSEALTKLEGKWVHVAATYRGNRVNTGLELYLNGAFIGSSAGGSGTYQYMNATSSNLYVGRDASTATSLYANGTITEVSIWDDILSNPEINEIYNDGQALDCTTHSSASNLIGYWRNQNQMAWPDLSTNSNTCTPDNVARHMLMPQGEGGRDIAGFIMNRNNPGFQGVGDTDYVAYINTGSTTTISAGTAYSVTVWLKPRDFSTNTFLGASDNNRLYLKSSTAIEVKHNGVSREFTINALTVDEWNHIGIVRNSSNVITLYVNGVINGGASTDTKTLAQDFQYQYLGSGSTTTTFRGAVDDLSIYNATELSQAQVQRNYKAGKRRHRN